LLFEHSAVRRDSNSQGGSSLGSVKVHSLTLLFTLRLPFLARNLASPCLGHEPKARVMTLKASDANFEDFMKVELYIPKIGF